MKKFVAIFVVLFTAWESLALATVGSKNAAYYGGTITVFNAAKDPVEGKLDTTSSDQLVFTAIEKHFIGKSFSIPYSRIADLEYGQKAGRRVGMAAATTVLLGPIGLLALFSKKRTHYVTIGFKDDAGKDQVAVVELGKDIVRIMLPILETRSGKKIEYQDDEARKSAN